MVLFDDQSQIWLKPSSDLWKPDKAPVPKKKLSAAAVRTETDLAKRPQQNGPQFYDTASFSNTTAPVIPSNLSRLVKHNISLYFAEPKSIAGWYDGVVMSHNPVRK